jgi:cytoskeletal protein RodZ
VSNGESVGEVLRSAREARDLTIAQAHQETKISVEVLEALEADDYGSFASETYLKGFLRNYAQFLGLDGDKLWSRISRKKSEGEEGTGTGAYWDVEEAVREERLSSPRIFKRFILPLMIVIIVVLAVLLVRERRKVKSMSTSAVEQMVDDGVMTIAADL